MSAPAVHGLLARAVHQMSIQPFPFEADMWTGA